MLLRLGGKFTLFVHPKHDLKKWVQHFGREFDELDRVPTWSTYFTSHPPDNEPGYYRELPYKALHPKRYTQPFSDVYNKIPYPTIEQAIQRASRIAFKRLVCLNGKTIPRVGSNGIVLSLMNGMKHMLWCRPTKTARMFPDAYLSEQEAN